MQIRIRSFWDINNAILGLLYSLITATVFQVMLKCLIGGLRPHFLAVCDPDVPPFGQQAGTGWTQIMYNRSICRGDKDKIDDSLESFPSGHSTAAFAGFIFLFLYLNAKLKVFANYHPSYWKLIAVYTPVLGATLIAGALTIDDFHNWYDVVAGAIIGTTMAVSAYRMVYASVWDFRFNHVPVARDMAWRRKVTRVSGKLLLRGKLGGELTRAMSSVARLSMLFRRLRAVWVCRLLSLRLVVRVRVRRLLVELLMLVLALEQDPVALACERGVRMLVLVLVRINLRPRNCRAGRLGLGCSGEAMKMFRSAWDGLYFGLCWSAIWGES
jgi:membrane-associated phospholipid phosphatase